MGININLGKFLQKLPSTEKQTLYPPGVFRAIDAAHNEASSDRVDWSSFSLEEALLALEHALDYVDYEDLDENGPHVNKGNAVHEYLLTMEAMCLAKRSRPTSHVNQDVQFF
ncbi:hypothetical protein QYF50_07110 [Paenibacillus vini]|uniref:hypothetical protein n=1 Tax=Paenibacillus vini TaxID=1476024 RepID=UPI0025B68B79|nr:hypothetical protein [Paenibacillus vini]MDN4067661.1 hypothetical protein [Paenibacillus vini]